MVQLPSEAPEDEHAPGSKLQKLRGWGYLLLWAPAICDLTGTTVCYLGTRQSRFTYSIFFVQLMNVGLLYTPVSIYQMTRGSLVLFVGVLSIIFLRRHLWLYQFCIVFLF